MLQLMPKHQLD